MAYTIQEVLKFIGFSKYASIQDGQGQDAQLLISDPGLKQKWEKLPKSMASIIRPLLYPNTRLKIFRRRPIESGPPLTQRCLCQIECVY